MICKGHSIGTPILRGKQQKAANPWCIVEWFLPETWCILLKGVGVIEWPPALSKTSFTVPKAGSISSFPKEAIDPWWFQQRFLWIVHHLKLWGWNDPIWWLACFCQMGWFFNHQFFIKTILYLWPPQEAESSGVQLDVRGPDGWMGVEFFHEIPQMPWRIHGTIVCLLVPYMVEIWYFATKWDPRSIWVENGRCSLIHSKLPTSDHKVVYILPSILAWQNVNTASTTFLVVVAWNLAGPHRKVIPLGDRYGTWGTQSMSCEQCLLSTKTDAWTSSLSQIMPLIYQAYVAVSRIVHDP